MVKQVIFLVYWPITSREAGRWGFDYLESRGFAVWVYDLSGLLNRKALRRSPVQAPLESANIIKFDSYLSFGESVRKTAGTSVYIDYIMGLAPVDFKTERVYRILGKHRARYWVISAGALPMVGRATTVSMWWRRLLFDLKLASNPVTLFNFLVKRAITFLTRYSVIYPTPALIFGGKSEVLSIYLARHKFPAERIVPIHSLDHDTYLSYLARGEGCGEDGTCVFLDEAATHHSDFALLGISPIKEEHYYASMNRFFDRIERETGLSVVIAAHPRSCYESIPDVFGGRMIVKGRTVDLVARSSLVLTHASTSVSFAVLFDKPLILVKTEGIARNSHYCLGVDTIADALGLKPFNIDKPGECHVSLRDYANLPRGGYPEYLYAYVKSRGLGDLTVWEVVSRVMARQDEGRLPAPDTADA